MKLYEIRVLNGEAEYTFIVGGLNIFSAITRFRKENWRRPWMESLSNISVSEIKERKEKGNSNG